MEVDLWNRTNINRPGAISTTHIPWNNTTDGVVVHLLKASETALKLLRSDLLRTELRVLYALLYVLNNSLRQHLTFRAIKQVEQCINRLNDMELESVLQDFTEMCPTKVQRLMGKATGQCEVPSQPTLEWTCLKVLGACKLMICMAECCCRAFKLVGQHLYWGEFVVLNLVLVSMLSRLWAFSNGIVRTLAPMYKKMMALLHEVSRAKPMPFLPDSTLPTDLEAFLGSMTKLPGGLRGAKGLRSPSALSRLFTGEGRHRKRKQPCLPRKSSRGSDRVDLGTVVSQSRAEVAGHLGGFDLKSMLKRPYGKNDQFVFGSLTPCKLDTPKKKRTSEELAVIGQKKSVREKLRAVSSLSDMAARLQEATDWFRSRRRRGESSRLRLLQLKCLRLKRLEEQGFRVNGKLRSLRRETGRALRPDETRRTEDFLFLPRCGTGRRRRSLHSLWRSQHRAASLSSNRRRPYKGAGRGGGPSRRPAGDRLSPEGEAGGGGDAANEDAANEDTANEDAAGGETSRGEQPSTSGQDDIDDIFASIGF